jgi:Flp pilus assembly protein TadG
MNAWKSSRFLAEMDGGVLVYSALGISLFLGCAGLAVDVSIWHAHSRQVQTITDAATLAYAQEFKRSKTDTDAEQQSRLHAANHGFDESDGDIIVFNKPPASGDFTSTADAIEVIIRRPVPVLLASLVFDENPRVTQRAVAAAYDPTD